MNLKTFTLTLASTRPIQGTSSELSSLFATKFTEYSLLRQHSADKLIYRYPLVQYKMIDGAPIDNGSRYSTQIYDKYYEIKHGGA